MFAECHGLDTRQTIQKQPFFCFSHSIQANSIYI
jgi:hypothetical protein